MAEYPLVDEQIAFYQENGYVQLFEVLTPEELEEVRAALEDSNRMILDDVDERNGCMQVVPKSHTWGRFEPINLINAQSIFDLVPDPDSKKFTPAVMRMPAGSSTFHHGLTFHYASSNQTDRPRRAMV